MRITTLSFDADLAQAIEEQARRSGKTLNEVIESALHNVFLEKKPPTKTFELRWVTVAGETQPDVDIDDRNALFERMEGRS